MPDIGPTMAADERRTRFVRLYEEHYATVLAYVRRRARPDGAHDIVSETFLVAWRRLEEVPNDAAPWLIGVARNAIVNARRSESRRRALAARIASEPSPVQAAARGSGEIDRIRAALSRLPAREREAITLVVWDGFSHRQAAEALGCTVGAVALRLHRARKRLLGELAGSMATGVRFRARARPALEENA